MQKKVLIPALLAVPILGLGASVVAADAAAIPAVSFTKIQYNSPGTDTRSTKSLNDEWVRMTNNTGKAIDLNNWSVRDKAGHSYTFTSYMLNSGARVYVHTGPGTNGKPDVQHRYQGSGNYIWNNNGDTATLKNNKGTTIDTCQWKAGNTPTYC